MGRHDMRYIKFVVRIIAVCAIVAVFDYTMPARDIVRIVGTEVVRTDIGANAFFWAGSDAGTAAAANSRDIRFINTVRPDEKPRVYRNQDTGWGWPPYLKFDSGNLQAEAQQLATDDHWVAVTHYGWRSTLISIYPNATKITPVPGPFVSLFPWSRVIAAVLLAVLGFIVWRIWVRFRSWLGDRFDRLRARF